MKIGIDARFLTHPQKGGFKTYTENLISALAEVDSINHYYLYLDRQPDENSKIPDKPNFIPRVIPSNLPILGMIWREQIRLPRQAQRDRLDLFHAPCLSAPLLVGCPSIITIHDLIWLFSNRFYKGKSQPKSLSLKLQHFYYRFVPQFAAKRASTILTVSEYSKGDINNFLGVAADRVFVTHEAAKPIYQPIIGDHQIKMLQAKLNIPNEFILSLGSDDPRKNIHTLLQAYAKLPESFRYQYPLVIVWSHNYLASIMKKQVAELGLSQDVFFLEWITDEELVLLYNAASLFVFPSLYEGFGLPLVEAMACGTPVLASNNSSIPEIVGESAVLFDPNNVEELTSKILEVMADEKLRSILTKKGLSRAADFSWEKCARETVKIYQKTIEFNPKN